MWPKRQEERDTGVLHDSLGRRLCGWLTAASVIFIRLGTHRPRRSGNATLSALCNSPNSSSSSRSLCYSCLCGFVFLAGSRTNKTWGHCVCADISWFLLRLQQREREREGGRGGDGGRNTQKSPDRQREQSHPPKTVHWIGVPLLSLRCPWAEGPLPPSSTLLSPSGSLWIWAVKGKCLWCLITTWHWWTLTALSNCLHELRSLSPASFGRLGTGTACADSTVV